MSKDQKEKVSSSRGVYTEDGAEPAQPSVSFQKGASPKQSSQGETASISASTEGFNPPQPSEQKPPNSVPKKNDKKK